MQQILRASDKLQRILSSRMRSLLVNSVYPTQVNIANHLLAISLKGFYFIEKFCGGDRLKTGCILSQMSDPFIIRNILINLPN